MKIKFQFRTWPIYAFITEVCVAAIANILFVITLHFAHDSLRMFIWFFFVVLGGSNVFLMFAIDLIFIDRSKNKENLLCMCVF